MRTKGRLKPTVMLWNPLESWRNLLSCHNHQILCVNMQMYENIIIIWSQTQVQRVKLIIQLYPYFVINFNKILNWLCIRRLKYLIKVSSNVWQVMKRTNWEGTQIQTLLSFSFIAILSCEWKPANRIDTVFYC